VKIVANKFFKMQQLDRLCLFPKIHLKFFVWSSSKKC
jgi:hypothetical protein